MAIKAKTFIHKESKLLGADGSADGVLPEDVQDWVTANHGTIDVTTQLNITMTTLGGNRVLTLIVLDKS